MALSTGSVLSGQPNSGYSGSGIGAGWQKQFDNLRNELGIALDPSGSRGSNYNNPYFSNQGTDYMYNGKYRSASGLENAIIDWHRAGDYLMNWQQMFAGPNATEEERDKFRFHGDRMDPLDFSSDFYKAEKWLNGENPLELLKFGVSLPGQAIGGLMQAPGQLIGEAVIGDPYTEYKKSIGSTARHGQELGEPVKDVHGNYLIPDYSLDLGQRAGQAVNAGINAAGFFTGGTGRVIGNIGKYAFTKGLTNSLAKSEAKNLGRSLTKNEIDDLRGSVKQSIKQHDLMNNPYMLEGMSKVAAKHGDEELAKVYKDALTAQRRAERWERRSKGLFTRGVERATGKEISKLTIPAQIGIDALEEGTEEFVQEYAESGARYKNDVDIKDALSAGIWGAVGGGVMSGSMAGINKARNNYYENKAQSQAASMYSPPTVNHGDKIPLGQHRAATIRSSAVADKYDERVNKQLTKRAGAGAMKLVMIDNNIEPDMFDIGDDFFVANVKSGGESLSLMTKLVGFDNDEQSIRAVENPDSFRKEALANNVKTTIDTSHEWGTAEALNYWEETHPNKAQKTMILGRSPATKLGGRHGATRRNWFMGNGLSMHAGMYQEIGSDLDGDMDNVYSNLDDFGDNWEFVGSRLTSPETTYVEGKDGKPGRVEGKSPIDWQFYGIVPQYYMNHPDVVRDNWAPILGQFTGRVDSNGELIVDANGNIVTDQNRGVSFFYYCVNEFTSICAISDDDYRNYRLSLLFEHIQDMVDQQHDNNGGKSPAVTTPATPPPRGRRIWAQMMSSFNGSLVEIVGKLAHSADSASIASIQQDLDLLDARYNDGTRIKAEDLAATENCVKFLETRGVVSGNRIADNYERLGLLAYYIGGKEGTVVFRQTGELYYPAMALPGSFWEAVAELSDFLPTDKSALKTLVRANFHMSADGVSPLSAMEGKLDALILAEAYSNAGINKDNLISTGAQLHEFLQALCDAMNKYNRTFNEINQGKNGIHRNDNITVNSIEFLDSFRRIMGSVGLSNLFNPNLLVGDNAITMTFEEFFDIYCRNRILFSQEFEAFPPEINDWIQIAINTNNDLNRSLIVAFREAWKEANGNGEIRGAIERADNNNGDFGGDLRSVVNWVIYLNEVFGYDVALYSGILDETGALTKYGRSLANAKSFEMFQARVIQGSLYFQYQYWFDQYNSETSTKEEKQEALEVIQSMKAINPLHAIISEQFIASNGTDTTVYDLFTNEDYDYAIMESFFNTLFGEVDANANMFIDAITSERTTFNYGALSNRARRARRASSSIKRALGKECKIAYNKIFVENTDQSTQDVVLGWLNRQALANRFYVDEDLIVSSVLESQNLGHGSSEKGTDEEAVNARHATTMNMVNGNGVSYQESVFSWSGGVIPLSQAKNNGKLFLYLWAHPDEIVQVVDDTGNTGIGEYTLSSIFKSVLGEDCDLEYGQKPTYIQVRQFFGARPDLLSLFTDTSAITFEESAQNASLDTIEKSFNDYRSEVLGIDSNDTDGRIKTGICKAQEWLTNQVFYEPYIIACCHDEIERGASDYEMARKIKEVHNQTVQAVFYYAEKAISDSNGTLTWDDAYDLWRKEVAKDIVETTSEAISTLKAVMQLRGAKPDLMLSAQEELSTDGRRKAAVKEINAELSSKGFKEIDPNFSSIQEQIDEINKQREKFIERRNEELEEHISNLGSINDYILKTKLGYDSDSFSLTMSLEDIRAIRDDIKKKNPTLSDDDIDTITTHGVSVGNNAVNLFDNTFIEEHVLDSSEQQYQDYLQNPQKLYQDVDKIYGYMKSATPENVVEQIDKIISKGKKSDYDELCNDLLYRLFESEISYVNSSSGQDINGGMSRSAERTLQFMDRAVNSDNGVRQMLIESESLWSGDQSPLEDWYKRVGSPRLPIPKFSSKKVQFEMSRSMSASSFGSGATNVGLNGGEVNKHAGYATLPQYDLQCSRGANRIFVGKDENNMPIYYEANAASVVRLVNELHCWSRERILDPKFTGTFDPHNDRNVEYVTFEQAIRDNGWDQMSEEELKKIPVVYFSQSWNPHGFSRANSQGLSIRGEERGIKQLSDCLRVIDSEAMESFVLKLKKSMGSRTDIVSKAKFNLFTREANERNDVDISDFNKVDNQGNIITSTQAYAEFLELVRFDFKELIYDEFKGDLSSTGFGNEQAWIIATHLTPGVTIEMEDGTDIFVDAYDILQNDQLPPEVTQAIINGGGVNNVRVEMVTFAQQANRILSLVRSSVTPGQKIDDRWMRATALSGLRWSNLNERNLGVIREVLNDLGPRNNFFTTRHELSYEPTNYQELLDRETEGTAGVSVSSVKPVRVRYREAHGFNGFNNSKEDVHYRAQAVNLQRTVFKFKKMDGSRATDELAPTSAIVKVWPANSSHEGKRGTIGLVDFIDKNVDSMFISSSKDPRQDKVLFIDSSNHIDDMAGFSSEPKNSAGIVWDKSQVSEAIKWGRETGNDVFVPQDALDYDFIEEYERYGMLDRNEVYYSEKIGIPFYRIKKLKTTTRVIAGNRGRAELQQRDFRCFSFTMPDMARVYNTGDGQGWITHAGRNLGIRQSQVRGLDLNNLFPSSKSVKELATIEQVKAIRDHLRRNGKYDYDDDTLWEGTDFNISLDGYKRTGIEKQFYRRAVARYLDRFVNSTANKNNIAEIRSDTGAGECIAMAYDPRSGKFAPIIAPENTANKYDECVIFRDGVNPNRIAFCWVNTETLDRALDRHGLTVREHMKASQSRTIAFKGNIALMPDSLNGISFETPRIGVQGFYHDANGENGDQIVLINDPDTEASRAVGNEWRLLCELIYNADKKSYGSLIFTSDRPNALPSEYKLNEHISKQIRNGNDNIGWTEKKIRSFLRGDTDIAWEVANGTLTLTNDPKINDVVSKLLTQCLLNNQRYLHMLTAINYDSEGNIQFDRSYSEEFQDILADWNQEDLYLLYYGRSKFATADGGNDHIIDSLTPYGLQNEDEYCPVDSRTGRRMPKALINVQGKMWTYNGAHELDDQGNVVAELGSPGYRTVRCTYIDPIADVGTNLNVNPKGGTTSLQNTIFNGMMTDTPLSDTEWKSLLQHAESLQRDIPAMQKHMRERQAHPDNDDVITIDETERNQEIISRIEKLNIASPREIREREIRAKQSRTLSYRRKILGTDGKPISSEKDLRDYNEMLGMIRSKLEWEECPAHVIDNLLKRKDGYTYMENGENDIPLDTWLKVARRFLKDLDHPTLHLLITLENGDSLTEDDRCALPWVTMTECQMFVQHSGLIQKWGYTGKNGAKELFDNANSHGEDALQLIESRIPETNRDRKVTYYRYADWIFHNENRKFNNSRYIFNGVYDSDYLNAVQKFLEIGVSFGITDDLTPAQAQLYIDTNARNKEALKRYARYNERIIKENTVESPGSPTGNTAINEKRDANDVSKALDYATRWVQGMSVLEPIIGIQNTTDRVVSQIGTRAMLNLAKSENKIHRALSSYEYLDRAHAFTDEEIEQIIKQPEFQLLWKGIRQLCFTGAKDEMLASLDEGGMGIKAFVQQYKENRNWFENLTDNIFHASAGFDIGTKQQMAIFLDQYIMFCEEYGLDYLFTPVTIENEDGTTSQTTYLKQALLGNGAANWFCDALGAHGDTLQLEAVMNAMQAAYEGDLAQRHIATGVIDHITRNIPAGKFITTTLISKFPNFAFNHTDNILGWVLPMHTIKYVVTEDLATSTFGEAFNASHYQSKKNLLNAMRCDMLHLGPRLMILVLLGLYAQQIQPPDDDRYMANIEEWTIFGMRVRDEWWIQDILGPVLPVVTFVRSCMLGKPMFPLIIDGTIGACYSNPFMRSLDVFELFTDPEGSIYSQYKRSLEEYKDAPGGGPENLLEYMRDNAEVNMWKFGSQFFTPAFVRSIGKMGNDERSYKTVYSTNQYGKRNKDDESVERVPYQEAILRKLTRNNPMLGLLFDQIKPRETGWLESEMPRVIYSDDAQLQSVKENDTKSALEILSIIQRYEGRMDELEKTGFYLSYEKKAEVSQLIWDNFYQAKTDWNEFAGSDEADFKILGDGDFNLGRQRYYEAKEAYAGMQRYWKDLYNNCIKNSYLNKPIQKYYRYKTTYDTDLTGTVYATGYRSNGIIPWPIQSAPGSLKDPEGTAGHENSWNSISAVTGKPMLNMQRGLIPIENEYEDWPTFEEWAENHDGEGFSANYNNKNGSSSNTSNSSSSGSSGGSGSGSGSSRRSGGGGRSGGSGGSGGGGGRGYYQAPPRISIQSSSNYPVSPSRIMSSNRKAEPDDVSYLRPGFETKGSREAYKRGDI